MPRLGVVITSTREGRVGAPVAEWFMERARQHGGFEVELVDLKADLSHERLPGMTLLGEAVAACPDAVPFLKAGGAK